MVTIPDLNHPGSSPGWVTVLCSWPGHFTLTVLLSTQEYKSVLVNPDLGGEGGGIAILLVNTECYGNGRS